MARFSTPRGTQDILPADWPWWTFVLGHAEDIATLYGYRRIETPTFGETDLFARTTGEGTDIVDKEMYSWSDRGGESLTLRPEGTAPVMRAYLQHGMYKLPQPVKLYYLERIYRREAPQRGRLREHHQFGCEAIGVDDAYQDVELIALLDQFYRRVGLDDLSLHVNSIGDENCRPTYVQELVTFLKAQAEALAATDRERIGRNPLRVLDSKEAISQPVVKAAPNILDYLCPACRAHWKKLRHGLDLLGIRYEIDRRLVRGLDYYNRTVFEFMPPSVSGAQSTIGGGGRYDPLSTAMGSARVPGVGFGTGIERIILNIKERGVDVPGPLHPSVYLTHQGEATEDAALVLGQRLRRAGVPAEMAVGHRSLKAQMRHAGSAEARFAAILGDEELQEGQVTLRDMQTGEQRRVPEDQLLDIVGGPPD